VYVQLGAFHKTVKCYVMDMLYKVDLILGEEFLDKYNCILHYGKGCIMIQKGKRHMTINSPALPRNQHPVDDEKYDSVLSASQVKRLARKGAIVFLAVIRSVESDSVSLVVASVATLSPGEPTTSVQLDQPAGPPGSEVPWVSELLSEFLEVFCNPLPPSGLPPERSEGHSIPTEPRSSSFVSVDVPFIFSGIPRVGEAGNQVFKGWHTWSIPESLWSSCLVCAKAQWARLASLCRLESVNSIIVKNCCTFPRIDDLFDAVAGSSYFTSLNLTSGSHQIF
jgi:hypothetical protein